MENEEPTTYPLFHHGHLGRKGESLARGHPRGQKANRILCPLRRAPLHQLMGRAFDFWSHLQRLLFAEKVGGGRMRDPGRTTRSDLAREARRWDYQSLSLVPTLQSLYDNIYGSIIPQLEKSDRRGR